MGQIKRAGIGPLFDSPADREEGATGYAVYDRTLGRYVGTVTPEEPTKDAVKAVVPAGHAYKVVRV